MATIIFCDSFDHYATADIAKKWTYTSGGGNTITSAAGRYGTNGLSCATGAGTYIAKRFNVDYNVLYVEFALRASAWSGNGFFYFDDAVGNNQLTFKINTGEIAVYRSGTSVLLGTTTTLNLSLNTWYHIGIYAKIDSAAGEVTVRVDTNPVLTLTAVNTRHSSSTLNSTRSISLMHMGSSANSTHYDDVVVSTDGFNGDCRVIARVPAGAGNYSQWSPVSTANYASGDRRGFITVTSDFALGTGGTGSPSAFVDGSLSNTLYFTTAQLVADHYIQFSFKNPVAINGATADLHVATAIGGTWQWQYSDDGTTWTNLGSSFTWGSGVLAGSSYLAALADLSANTTVHFHYRLLGVSGTASTTPYVREFTFSVYAVSVLRYTCVNESAPNAEVDYLYSATAGERVSFDFAAVGVTGNVKAVQHLSVLRKGDAGSKVVQQFVRIAGADYDDANVYLFDDYFYFRQMLVVNPASSAAWNTTDIDAAEFGTEVVS